MYQNIDQPLWVKVGLFGLPERGYAWSCFWLSIAIAVGCVAYGFRDMRFFVGGVFIFSAFWYYASIRWMDRNDGWS